MATALLSNSGHSSTMDPYELLGGLDRSATAADIRSAYKKQAIIYHPDKNRGDETAAAIAAEKFGEVSKAYAILSDPEARRAYDVGGVASVERNPNLEVDISQLGTFSKLIASTFSKMGVPIKTTISPAVLDAASSGNVLAKAIGFGEVVNDKVEKGACNYYQLQISQQDLDEGFAVSAFSASNNKLKLLWLEPGAGGGYEISQQEDSARVSRGGQLAGLFFLPFDTYSIGPKLSAVQLGNDPEALLFRRLEGMVQREKPLGLKPGVVMFGVYGDSWFKAVQFQLQALKPRVQATSRLKAAPSPHGLSSNGMESGKSDAGADAAALSRAEASRDFEVVEAVPAAVRVREVEAELLRHKTELRSFEQTYREAQRAFEAASEQYKARQARLEAILSTREEAYQDLLAVPTQGEELASFSHRAAQVYQLSLQGQEQSGKFRTQAGQACLAAYSKAVKPTAALTQGDTGVGTSGLKVRLWG